MVQTKQQVTPPSTWKQIVLPGLLMCVTQLRAVLSFGTPSGMSTNDTLWILFAVGTTCLFVMQWYEWRTRRVAQGASPRQALLPLGCLAFLPLLFAGGYLFQWAGGPSPYSTLKESALTGCNLPGNEWRDARGKVGVMEAPDGEIIYVYNVQNAHGDAVIRTRATPDADYDWYASLVLDGRTRRAERVLCFDQGSPSQATLNDISTGAPAGTADEVFELIRFANS